MGPKFTLETPQLVDRRVKRINYDFVVLGLLNALGFHRERRTHDSLVGAEADGSLEAIGLFSEVLEKLIEVFCVQFLLEDAFEQSFWSSVSLFVVM